MKKVIVSGGFDDLRSAHIRFLQQAATLGPVHALLWPGEIFERREGKPPKFPEAERRYLLESNRYVDRVTLCPGDSDADALPPELAIPPAVWVVNDADDTAGKRAFCLSHGLEYRRIAAMNEPLRAAERTALPEFSSTRKRVIVTGCFDWFHSGHVRFFEEVAALGDLYVVVGHDANIRLLKGAGHPLFPECERQYLVQAVRFVKQALISSGSGWLDAEPEIERLRPHIYAVNEDGDRPEKRLYCERHGIEYRVLRRLPKAGLPLRQSTNLRGF